MTSLPHRLDRTVVIKATPDTVFRFFTESDFWAKWWGAGSTVDSRPGGKIYIRYPDGTEAAGEVIAVTPPSSIVFTYGFTKGAPIPLGGSRVSINLEDDRGGTMLRLTHEFADEKVRAEFVQGWRYQLALFSNVVADLVNENAAGVVDTWFDLWANPDADARETLLTSVAEPGLRFRDRYGNTEGIPDLLPHIAAAQYHMPGITLRRDGAIRHCQGTVLADWAACGPDGQVKMKGTNVFTFGPTGRVESVIGVAMLSS